MKIKNFAFLFILFIFFFKSQLVFAQQKNILINEVLIDSSPQQVELINLSSESTYLDNWQIDDDGGSSAIFTIPTNSIIYPNSCLVFSSNFYLNTKSQDTVRLFDDKNNLVDSFSYSKSPGQNISFQRLPDGENNWATAEANLGYFNNIKLPCLILPTTTPTPMPTLPPTPTITPSPTSSITTPPTLQPISFDNIFISEVMVNPLTGEKEWVEIYNDNDFPVNLINWYLDDIENAGSSPKTFSVEINSKSYQIIFLSTSIFNNDGDSVRILDFNKNLKDSFEYIGSQNGKTWGRISFDSDQFCLQDPSPNQKNNPCLNQLTKVFNSNSKTNQTQITLSSTKKIKNSLNSKNKSKITQKILNNSQNNTNLINNETVLGISTKRTSSLPILINQLFLLSFIYSLLTIFMIFLKIDFIYGKVKKLFSSLIYTQ
ncbi:MAG: lamin tail domain-containing protein [Microgenomates group bacterium]